MIKDASTYALPTFIEFIDDKIIHFELSDETVGGQLKKKQWVIEKLSEAKYEFINENRIRIYSMGKKLTVSETESISEEMEFHTDYERIKPTNTKLTYDEIQQLNFKAEWNGEKIPLVFNKSLDSPTMQEVNKRLKQEGKKLVLESLQGTYFGSIYLDGNRITLIGIKEIDKTKSVLFGFPEEPYEIVAE